ncbi:hypothetical protein C2E23DRAFT_725157 [Lenzites betulinus]|nr:hypothetical protein C2E23DRAFT_725157 [Lenzites betulinus]
MATVDNCCHVKATIHKVFPDISVCLDVWHFMMRYMICIIGGMKNPARSAVAQDIVNAILKSTANGNTPAVYWSQPEQERRLAAAYKKWSAKGDVWSAAAAKTHAEQLSHVRKGCLARPRSDVRSDGSRIESSHKGWNNLQRSFASGLESLTALAHDFVLRRNIRVEMAAAGTSPFTQSTYGCHHVRLVDECARIWNAILDATQQKGRALPADIKVLPLLDPVNSGETFGLTTMGPSTAAHHGLVVLKEEPIDDDLFDLSSQDLLNAQRILSDIGVDPALAYQLPQQVAAVQPANEVPQPPSSGSPPRFAQAIAGNAGRNTDTASSSPAPDPSTSQLANALGHLPIELSHNHASQPIDIDALDPSPSPHPPSTGSTHPINIDTFQADHFKPAVPRSGLEVGRRKRRASVEVDALAQASQSAVASDQPVLLHAHDSRAQPSPTKKSRIMVPGTPKTLIARSGLGTADARLNSAITKAQPYEQATSFMSAPTTAQLSDGQIDQFFAASQGSSQATLVQASLPAPVISGMTRSQRLFSVATGIDARSLSFACSGDSDEFYLFMRLRKEHQWASFRMTPFNWVCAASLYNTELRRLNHERGKSLVSKTPRALMEKLGDIEPDILGRLATGNYASRKHTDSPFWREHCHAVPLGTKIQGKGEVNGKAKGSTRKNHICSRCKTIKYPGPEGSSLNHKKLCCSDGVRQATQKVQKLINDQAVNVFEEPPPFPQPQGVFTSGTHFHPIRFIAAAQELYERVVMQNTPGGASAMQDLAFASLLRERVQVLPATEGEPSMALFKLYASLQLSSCPSEILIERAGEKFLRIDYLSDPPLAPLAPLAPPVHDS